MAQKQFLSVSKYVVKFLSPQPLSKSPTKCSPSKKYFLTPSPKAGTSRRNVSRKLNFEKKINYPKKIEINNLKVSVSDYDLHNKEHDGILCLDSPFKQSLLAKDISNFNLEKCCQIIGKGKFGQIVQVKYHNQLLSAKMIKNTKLNQKTIENEQNALKLGPHPNIVRTIDIFFKESNNLTVILMENTSYSKSLHTLFFENNNIIFNTDFKKRISLDICYGIQACHNSNTLHLDIKPQNILVDPQYHGKLCDFGSSLNLNDPDYDYAKYCGTYMYTAPEIFRGHKPDTCADIYSLGITLWQLEYQEIPYANLLKDFVIYNVCKNNLRPKSCPVKNGKFKEIYEVCWSGNKDERPNIIQIIKMIKNISE